MKNLIFISLIALCFSTVNGLPANVVNLTLTTGGLQTPDTNIPGLDHPFLKPSHSVGGIAYRIGLIHFIPRLLMRLAYELRVGIEADYSQYADNTYQYGLNNKTTYTYTSSSLSALAVAQYPLPHKWLLTGKCGVARVAQTLKSNYSTQTLAQFHPQFIAGIGYAVNQQLQFNLLYNYITGDAPSIRSNNNTAPISTYDFNINLLF